MNAGPITGHDGPYAAPIEVSKQTVLPDWIDYNGHMNVGYYGIAFDKGFDVLFDDHLGVGGAHVAATGQGPYVLQSHIHFLQELKLDERFSLRFYLLDHDHKRLHFFGEMLRETDGALCATQEVMVMNVDHATGRSAPYPDWAQRRFARMRADHAGLEAPATLGQPIGIRRKAEA
ncbi:MAG: thioesterase family protein [Rhodobacteraceae bacterium]|nr:thioesterase family protein [Paracoccaceae bacterium]